MSHFVRTDFNIFKVFDRCSSAKSLVKDYYTMAFSLGKLVEVIGKNHGLKLSIFEATIIGLEKRKIKVRYATFLNDDGSFLQETLNYLDVCLYPPTLVTPFKCGDEVDVWENNGWWTRKYVDGNDGSCRVYFSWMPAGERHNNYPFLNARLHGEWSFRNLTSKLVYEKVTLLALYFKIHLNEKTLDFYMKLGMSMHDIHQFRLALYFKIHLNEKTLDFYMKLGMSMHDIHQFSVK
ncbi:hypothetical protein LXL04_020451 [Taraxacum kok-saghyz]